MNDSIKIAKELNEILKNHPLIIEFKKVENEFLTSKYLLNLKNEINYYKKCTMSNEDREKYLQLKKEYDNNPLVINYKQLKEEVDDFKKEIVEYILK